jgi:hypothetical protein
MKSGWKEDSFHIRIGWVDCRALSETLEYEGEGDDGPSVGGGYHPHEGRLCVPPRSFGPNKMRREKEVETL